MPLTPKGEKIKKAMDKEYGGKEKGDEVFYASRNKGTISGVEGTFGVGPQCRKQPKSIWATDERKPLTV